MHVSLGGAPNDYASVLKFSIDSTDVPDGETETEIELKWQLTLDNDRHWLHVELISIWRNSTKLWEKDRNKL